MAMDEFFSLLDMIRGRPVYIQTHNFPDPDAIASAYALGALLSHYGVKATLCYHGGIDKLSARKMIDTLGIDIRPYTDLRSGMSKDDPIICVDSQKNAGNILDFVGDEVAAIDHHPTFVEESYVYQDIRIVGSCSTLIAEYFQKLDVPMGENVATALLYGLKMDTAHFTRGVTALDIDMFRFLFTLANPEKVYALEKNTLEYRDLRAYGAAIENIKVYGSIGLASIPFPCPDALVAVVADFILSLEEITVAIVYSYRDMETRFSVRSEDPQIHAGKLVNLALKGWGNGGGHAEMAAGSISSDRIQHLGRFPDDEIRNMFLRTARGLKNPGERT